MNTRRVLLFSLLLSPAVFAQEWKPVPGRILTKWAQEGKPEAPLPEYPRPQMVRREWVNLNGLWDYAITPQDAAAPPEKWDGKILVPFAIESALSGVGKEVGPDKKLWYRLRTGKISPQEGRRWLLHFGAVDWQATVWVNGTQLGGHKGGFAPFSFDATAAIKEGEQEIIVSVWDPTDSSHIPRGKQVRRPGGIFYTSVTGIWQTVWAEPVGSHNFIKSLDVSTDYDRRELIVKTEMSNPQDDIQPEFVVSLAGEEIARVQKSRSDGPQAGNAVIPLPADKVKEWSPESPVLYTLRVGLPTRSGRLKDEVESYFALRKISLGKDEKGVTRIFLNNKPYFHYGPLDQGWWPDGLYTAPTDAALKFDIEQTKRWGMNMLRKHVKVEPARFYYWCDKLGILVWQDMPSGDKSIRPDEPDLKRSPESAANFEAEWTEIIRHFRHFPSIIMWVPFNEGWGQYDTARIVEMTRQLDPGRLVNCASGWTDRPGVGDVHDMHNYPGPGMFPPEEKRASVLGEFGGLGLAVPGHTWVESDKNWGYRTFKEPAELIKAYEQLLLRLRPLVAKGLSAAVYTQTTDVEVEVNGLMTYDRAVIKIPESTAALAKKLIEPMPAWKVLVPTAESAPQIWRLTMEKPAEGWEKEDFYDKPWKEAPGGFGEKTTPGAVVRTSWKSSDIWLRRTFEIASMPPAIALRLHHDEDVEVYLNGRKIAAAGGFSTEYFDFPLDDSATAALKPGRNVLAVHCRQTGGGQYVDVGILAEDRK